MNKIKITAVSYLNTKPFLYGIFKTGFSDQIDLQLDIPSVCAQRLRNGEAELGLIPVAAIPELENAHIVSDFCIGTEGAVKTVGIFADQPLEKLTHLYLDHHSRTSAALTRILLDEYWELQPELLPAEPGFIDRIGGAIGGLVIGDRTIGLEKKHRYFYDLGTAWKAHTGLPFVFAAWVSTRPLDPEFVRQFNQVLQLGIHAVPQLVYLLPSPDPDFDLQDYFEHNISYSLDAPKRKALDLFLSHLRSPMQALRKKVG